jgi:hypothetical protein
LKRWISHRSEIEKNLSTVYPSMPLSIWHALAFIGRYDILIKAAEKGKFDLNQKSYENNYPSSPDTPKLKCKS